MKSLHRPDLYTWSAFDADRNVDFNSIAWVRPEGNILIDPLPLSDHDWNHLNTLGGAAWIIVTNSDHIRDAQAIAQKTQAKIAGPQAERDIFPFVCDRWLGDGDEVVPGLLALELHGSKTPGELALLLDDIILITGDLVRSHQANQLMLLPEGKLKDRERAIASVQRLANLEQIETVLVGDGWSIFSHGHQALEELV
ncbi:MAG: MBL fold metallo-hydrolase [Acaryochloridaceae cyanobacterium RU_4_10]|nr:MBL fold metallo-hydrolase [Acaryochloridaceae cyanobacterium RU_4_10]